MFDAYARTLIDYALVAAAMAVSMYLVYRVLVKLRMKREAATGIALITPWLLGFIIWKASPILASLY